jgi:eukaryotic-like serine/threonine-protein kinase
MEESRENVMHMAVPNFCELDTRIDQPLNRILHLALERDLARRYQAADDLLYDLEHYIYHSGYGPTNETIGKYIRELFGQHDHSVVDDTKGGTILLERANRASIITSKPTP